MLFFKQQTVDFMQILRDGYYFFFIFLVFSSVSYFFNRYVSMLFLVVGVFCVWFFRDPDRKTVSDDTLVYSACDGKIMDICETSEPEFLKTKAVQISAFLSPFDAHINRAPIKGMVKKQERMGHGFAPAFLESAKNNSKNFILIKGKRVDVLVVQVVGLVARRIVSWVGEGDNVLQGQKIGMLRFGSRTDVFVPKSKVEKILVKKGERVFAGKTVLLQLK